MSVSKGIYRPRNYNRTEEEKHALQMLYKANYAKRNAEKLRKYSQRYREENREAIALRKRIQYAINPEPQKLNSRQYHRKNYIRKPRKPAASHADRNARRKEWTKAWSAKNRESLNRRKRAYEKAHPEQARRRARNLWKNNPEKVRQRIAVRRARKLMATVGNPKTIMLWERTWRAQKTVRCFWCNERFIPKRCQTDHIQALTKGGAHSIENLCISCADCNRKKNAQSLEIWNGKITQPALL